MELQVDPRHRLRKSGQRAPQPDRDAFWKFCNYASARAKTKGGSLTAYDLDKLFVDQGWRCAVSGIQFSRTGYLRATREPFGPSLDRIVAGGPYELGNVRLVCNIVNMAMREWGESALLQLVDAMKQMKGPAKGWDRSALDRCLLEAENERLRTALQNIAPATEC